MFRISTEIRSSSKIVGEERAVELLAQAGFDAWDFSMFDTMCVYDWANNKLLSNDHPLGGNDYLKFARRLRKIGEDNGIVCNQSHAPYPSKCKEVRSYYKRALECSAEAGAEICVIHPDNDSSPQENAEMYLEILPYAKECGVKIATENMWNWDDKTQYALFAACANPESFVQHLDAVNDDYFVACLDIGHAEMQGLGTDSETMIRALGKKLQAIHLHDNDKRNDFHAIPFSGDIDFDVVVKALKENGYKGDFTLEADSFLLNYTEDNIMDGMKKLVEAASKIRNKFFTID